MVTLRELLEEMAKVKASDLHLTAGVPGMLRVDGELVASKTSGVLTPEMTQRLAYSALNDDQKKTFENNNELDFSFGVKGLARFRGNCFVQRGVVTMVIRVIPFEVVPFESLGLPSSVQAMGQLPQGLVLLTGPTGSGKSTTLASLIDRINVEKPVHIVTIEDPIEFVHVDKRSSVSQRELGLDTQSFAHALRASLRQDPDVIQVGEIRDFDTMEIALKAAETGHLVLSTLHTPDVSRTMNRIIALSDGEADDLRERLGDALQGIIAQRLLPRADGQGMALAAEVLVSTGSVRETIKRPLGNPSLKELMDSGQSMYGMQTFESHIKALIRDGVVDREVGRAAMGF
jgi:twitching motility protein PilT